jgi:hypothetical protein
MTKLKLTAFIFLLSICLLACPQIGSSQKTQAPFSPDRRAVYDARFISVFCRNHSVSSRNARNGDSAAQKSSSRQRENSSLDRGECQRLGLRDHFRRYAALRRADRFAHEPDRAGGSSPEIKNVRENSPRKSAPENLRLDDRDADAAIPFGRRRTGLLCRIRAADFSFFAV